MDDGGPSTTSPGVNPARATAPSLVGTGHKSEISCKVFGPSGIYMGRNVYEGVAAYPLENPSKVWKTVLEVIDPRRGVVLARREFDQVAIDFVSRPSLSVVLGRQDDRGEIHVQVVPIALDWGHRR